MEHRDIITGSTDPDPAAEIESISWRGYWNILLPLFMSLLLGFSSCHDEDLPNPPERELVPASFSVEIEGDAETRLSFDDNGENLDFHFDAGDKIKLYDGCDTPHELTYNAGEAKLKGSVCPGRSYANYRAVYPASTTSDYNKVSISATQTAVNGSFDKASAPMIANYDHENNKLLFKRAFSLLKIKVPAGYSKIVVSNYGSDYLTGNATLTYNLDVSISKTEGESSVSLLPASGQEIAAGTYYMCVFPSALSGLQLACYNGDKISFKCKKASDSDDSSIDSTKGIILGDLTDSGWTFTCEAYKITPPGSSGSYYLADRNIGATSISVEGTSYPKSQVTTSIPSSEWGPSWSMPYRLELKDWADMINLSTSEDIAVTSGDYPEIKFPLCSYWGYESDNLYVTYLNLYKTSEGIYTEFIPEESASIGDSYKAAIRPVFTVPAP